MDNVIKFTIEGIAVPKGRPRVSMKRGYPVTYTPEKTKVWEDYVRILSAKYRPANLLEGALAIGLTFYVPRPRLAPKDRKYPEVIPDLDNYAKAFLDSMEGLFYRNDSQIVDMKLKKRYGNPARVEVRIWNKE